MEKRLYGEGRYADSIRAFQAAYRLNPLPGLLQNIGAATIAAWRKLLAGRRPSGKSTRQMPSPDFERYLAAADPPADPATQSRIAALRLRLRGATGTTSVSDVCSPGGGEVAKERPPLARRPWF